VNASDQVDLVHHSSESQAAREKHPMIRSGSWPASLSGAVGTSFEQACRRSDDAMSFSFLDASSVSIDWIDFFEVTCAKT
jgi:hypothetical protein